MGLEQTSEYLVGERIMELTQEGRVAPLQKTGLKKIKDLSKKERALRFNGFVITDKRRDIIFEDRKRYAQHFFPLSVIDYAKAMYNLERHNQPIPILSIDSHDVLQCDFKCQDCLSAHGTNFPVKQFPKGNFKMDLETYKRMLKAIVDYSEKRGFKGVRFEPRDLRLLYVKEIPNFFNKVHAVQFVYGTALNEQTPIRLGKELDSYRWFDLSNLPERTLDTKEDFYHAKEKLMSLISGIF